MTKEELENALNEENHDEWLNDLIITEPEIEQINQKV
jgi:hypothetical protein